MFAIWLTYTNGLFGFLRSGGNPFLLKSRALADTECTEILESPVIRSARIVEVPNNG